MAQEDLLRPRQLDRAVAAEEAADLDAAGVVRVDLARERPRLGHGSVVPRGRFGYRVAIRSSAPAQRFARAA